jgi:GntR family transcriptional regulator, transcriptional repressor for pyruvate dehydrogenase complex
MFTRVKPRSVSDDIVDQVISAVISGDLSVGQRLPAERALAQTFGVGRQALREAIQKLTGMGLLEVRKPQGTFVRGLATEVLQQSLTRLFNGGVGSFLRFLDLRKWLEAMTAVEAAGNATAEDIARIEATLPELKTAAAKSDREALDQADVAFHMAIVAATHNAPLVHLVDTFGEIMWASHGLRLAVLRAQNLRTICEEHAAIADAIKRGLPDESRDAMLRHIEMIRARVERTYCRDEAAAAQTRAGLGRMPAGAAAIIH